MKEKDEYSHYEQVSDEEAQNTKTVIAFLNELLHQQRECVKKGGKRND